jgi:glycerol-3-phosphate dehydrogenase
MEVLELVRNNAKLKQRIVPGLPEIWAEAAYAARNEMALHPADILERRTHVALKQPLRASQVTEKLRETLRLFRK